MPSQQQLRWSQLRVGLTVIVASLVLALLIFLMSGSGGPFGNKLNLRTYFQSAAGLRVGAPVALEGVTIGNVSRIRVVSGRQLDPVEVTLRVDERYRFRLKKDSKATLTAAGVLGDLYVDISSREAKGQEVKDGDTLPSEGATSIEDTIKAGQTTLQNFDVLLRRLDRILQTVESGEGTIGKFIKDPALFNRATAVVADTQRLVADINAGRGTIGKLLKDEELYRKLSTTAEKADRLIADIDAGKGTAGRLLKDEALYRNANDTLAKANRLMEDINSGKGAIGKFASDPEFARKFEDVVSRLTMITQRLEAGEGAAGQLLRNPALYNNADQMLVETRNLVKSVRENPKKYLTIHFRLF